MRDPRAFPNLTDPERPDYQGPPVGAVPPPDDVMERGKDACPCCAGKVSWSYADHRAWHEGFVPAPTTEDVRRLVEPALEQQGGKVLEVEVDKDDPSVVHITYSVPVTRISIVIGTR